MKLTVITVCWNSEQTIRDTLESVLNQTYNNIEHIIIDGDSTDNTLNIAKEYLSLYSLLGKKLYIYSEKDNGIYDAINKGIKKSTGKIISILNSDDFYTNKNVVEKIISVFVNIKPQIIYGNLIGVNWKNNKKIREWTSKPYSSNLFIKSWTPAHPTFFTFKSNYEKFGLYRTDLKIASDVDLMLRFLEIHRLDSYHLDETLVTMRIGGASTRGFKSNLTIIKEMFRVFKDHDIKFSKLKYILCKLSKISEFFRFFDPNRLN
jgi:glycosyltransferase involved in cell wall biosynthesis